MGYSLCDLILHPGKCIIIALMTIKSFFQGHNGILKRWHKFWNIIVVFHQHLETSVPYINMPTAKAIVHIVQYVYITSWLRVFNGIGDVTRNEDKFSH